ncbi:hypothetical protein [Neolewinella persica]|uniref:hypothetical protein n=1 Tax=Neolewinella persica TaxID=70998 RepID=UPI0003610F43|nr:hypothetical protein [Neolewinella persica]
MKLISSLTFGLALFALGLISTACVEDACSSVSCRNGGTCDDGTCDCPPGTAGEFCQDLLTVQNRLDNGESPMEIINSGTPVSELYGAFYAGGLIFFVDVNGDLPGVEGLVAAPQDQSAGSPWGCRGTDLPVPNASFVNNDIGGQAYEIGSGASNTQTIVSACPGAVARMSTGVDFNGTGWFLPSGRELEAMQENLAARGFGGFTQGAYYWSSSEDSRNSAVGIRLSPSLLKGFRDKNDQLRVRSARAF